MRQYYFLKRASVCEKETAGKYIGDNAGIVIAMANILFHYQLSSILHLY